jgi:hypothetical protein
VIRAGRAGLAAAAVGIAAILGAGYAAAGPAGLIDAAALAAVVVLIVARGTIPGRAPRSVRPRPPAERAPALRSADFAAYVTMASDLEWAQMSRRHYEYTLRPLLARLATALGRREAAAELSRPPSAGVDGPGADLAALDRVVAMLEREDEP